MYEEYITRPQRQEPYPPLLPYICHWLHVDMCAVLILLRHFILRTLALLLIYPFHIQRALSFNVHFVGTSKSKRGL